MVDYVQIAGALAVPIGRGVAGWLENSLADGAISTFEWKQLASTVFRVGTLTVFAYFGVNGFGLNVDAVSVAFGATVVDFIISKLNKAKKK